MDRRKLDVDVEGTCKLCGATAQLRDSHLLPRSIYRFIRLLSNKDPVLMTIGGSRKASGHIKDYLLCGACEKRFDDGGERYVLGVCYRGLDKFKLFDSLSVAPVFGVDNKLEVQSTSGIEGVDSEKITYFALSVIWRAAVHDWKMGDKVLTRTALGPYEERIRRYLLGEEGFPKKTALLVAVSRDKNPRYQPAAFSPYSVRFWGHHNHRFGIPGITFDYFVGKAIQAGYHEVCFAKSADHFVVRSQTDRDVLNAYERLGSPI